MGTAESKIVPNNEQALLPFDQNSTKSKSTVDELVRENSSKAPVANQSPMASSGREILLSSITSPSLPIIRRKSMKQEMESYSQTLLRQFQAMERLNSEKLRKSYSEFISRHWLTKILTPPENSLTSPDYSANESSKESNENNITNSSKASIQATAAVASLNLSAAAVSASLNNNNNNYFDVQKQLELLIYDLLRKKVAPLEVYDAVFADYHVVLSDEEAQNKVMLLTQLKTRDSASFIRQTSEDEQAKAISNPFLSLEQVRDFLLLAIWPVFQEYEKSNTKPNSPRGTLTSEASAYFRRNSRRISRAFNIYPEMEKTESFSSIKDERVLDNKDSVKTVSLTSSPERNTIKDVNNPDVSTKIIHRPSFSNKEGNNPAVHRPSFSTNEGSNHEVSIKAAHRPSFSTGNAKLSKLEIERQRSLLSLVDVVSSHFQTCNDLTTIIKSGKWWQANVFLNHLENINVAIAIHAVEREGKFFPLIFVNKAWESTTGHQRQDVLGFETRFLQAASTERVQIEKFEFALKEGYAIKLGLNLQRKDNPPFYGLFAVAPVYDQKGQYRYVVTILYDVQKAGAMMREIKHTEEVLYLLTLAMRYL